ncbi:aminotransferase class III-fold pyridoxal phosphate-dependent enzyme [Candidatus Bipolaricaulota bacterium]|nr:aminotransferase class III-fold pyridoxal phosphate-dependent enzyme [Candidatus Bipolaricaulota bacterium]
MNYTGPKIVTSLPGPKAQGVIERDLAMLSPSLTRTAPLVGVRAEGVYVEDIDGNVFLDFGSGIGVTGVGHRHPKVIEAVKKQLDALVFVNSLDYYTLPQVELAEMLFKVTPGDFPKRVFYSNSGSESIDTAIKMAKWHSRRAYGVGFINGFHGRTMGATSFTTTNLAARRGFSPLYPIAQFTPYPYCYRCLFNRTYPGCDMECMNYLTDVVFKKIIAPDETAFILFEPVQGAGGYIVPPKEFFTILSDLAKKHGILMIADEVQTGYGRTGKMFACEHFGFEPDIITMSKAFANGFPAAATVARREVMDWDDNAHEGTLNGGPVIMEAAKAVLRVIDEEKILENVRIQGEYLRAQLDELQKRYSIIGDIRGMGLMIGIELVKDEKKTPAGKQRDELIQAAFSRGLLLMAAGASSLRLIPPMIINREQIDTGLAIMEDCLKELH